MPVDSTPRRSRHRSGRSSAERGSPARPTRCRGRPTEAGDYDASLRKVLRMLGEVPAGNVAVYSCEHGLSAHLGELSVTSLKARGVAGCVLDGGCRDVGFILEEGFPVFCGHVTPEDSTWSWELEETQVPITIGRVRIEPGDWIVGDDDGVVVVPRADRGERARRGRGEGCDGERDPRGGQGRDVSTRGVRALRDLLAPARRRPLNNRCQTPARAPA